MAALFYHSHLGDLETKFRQARNSKEARMAQSFSATASEVSSAC
jgi:hypothetical protein